MLQAIWIEIPVIDLERAIGFYKAVFELQDPQRVDEGVRQVATFVNATEERAGISLNKTSNFEPMNKGVLVYFNAGEDLSTTLARVVPAGGRIVEGKTSMGAAGFYATFEDTEGNCFALYSFQ